MKSCLSVFLIVFMLIGFGCTIHIEEPPEYEGVIAVLALKAFSEDWNFLQQPGEILQMLCDYG